MTQIARGLQGVYVNETKLSLVDGMGGRLIIAGFPVEEIAPNAVYEEALFLLWNNHLPRKSELGGLRREMAGQRALPPVTLDVLRAAAGAGMPVMDALRVGVDSLSLSDPAPGDASEAANGRRAVSLAARFPSVIAAYWRFLQGKEPLAPDAKMSHAAGYLYMISGERPHPSQVRALDTYLNTVIDHGMNNSTFSARVIVSTRTDMYSAIVGAIGALKGPLHGGAPGPALNMVFEIEARARKSGQALAAAAEAWAHEALEAGKRVMGFGHRVYKVRDPRADVLDRAAVQLFQGAGDTKLYEDARAVEQVMLRVLEQHRPGSNIKTNVEYYTALVLQGIGLPVELFTPTFAVSRVGGWTAHVLEQIREDELIRPLSEYTGPVDRKSLPLEER
ncbi:MAG: citrate/2-methylcitrate synthase, partial [Anaerolineales bacterium]